MSTSGVATAAVSTFVVSVAVLAVSDFDEQETAYPVTTTLTISARTTFTEFFIVIGLKFSFIQESGKGHPGEGKKIQAPKPNCVCHLREIFFVFLEFGTWHLEFLHLTGLP